MKKNEILPFAAKLMELEIIILSQTKTKFYGITYMWNFKNSTNLSTKHKKTHRHNKQTYGYQGEKGYKE